MEYQIVLKLTVKADEGVHRETVEQWLLTTCNELPDVRAEALDEMREYLEARHRLKAARIALAAALEGDREYAQGAVNEAEDDEENAMAALRAS